MDELKLIEIRKAKVEEVESTLKSIETEGRKLSNIEENYISNLNIEIENIDKELDEKREKIKNNNIKHMEKFSLLKAIRDNVEGRQASDATLNALEQGKKAFASAGISYRGQLALPMEYRADIIATGGGVEGGVIVTEDKQSLLGALRAKTVLGQAGATIYSGLVGDVSIPVYNGSTVNWAYETSGATDGAGSFSEITLTPKRLTGYIDISKQFLIQDSIGAEQALYQDLMNAILVKVEASALDATAASATRPAGIFSGAGYALSGATSYSAVVSMKGAVDTSNALTGNLSYITNPTLAAKMETTTCDTGSGVFVHQNGKVAGYPVYVTSNVPTISGYQGIIFGNWNDFVVGQWAGMDISIDPYSQAINGKIRIVVNTYWDFKVRRSASFNINKLS